MYKIKFFRNHIFFDEIKLKTFNEVVHYCGSVSKLDYGLDDCRFEVFFSDPGSKKLDEFIDIYFF
jgi:hypothetical protein